MRFVYLLESPRRADYNRYTKHMIYKNKVVKSIRYWCFRRVYIKFLYNSKFDLIAKSSVTNSVVITRVLCTSVFFKRGSQEEITLSWKSWRSYGKTPSSRKVNGQPLKLSPFYKGVVLGKLPVPGRPTCTIWMIVGQGSIALAVGAGLRGCLDIFILPYPLSLSPSLWDWYRLKYYVRDR